MLTLLILALSFTPEHGPFLFQTFWLLAVCEMAVEAGAVRWLSRRRAHVRGTRLDYHIYRGLPPTARFSGEPRCQYCGLVWSNTIHDGGPRR